MGFLRDLEKLVSALLTPRVWGLGENVFRAEKVSTPF